jgi:hypothetical protein
VLVLQVVHRLRPIDLEVNKNVRNDLIDNGGLNEDIPYQGTT